MNVENISDALKQWNPMENDYKNAAFNKYISGPGAELDAELQPGQQALQHDTRMRQAQKRQPVPTLIFKNLPKDMSTKALNNICSRHGRVTAVRDSKKNDFYFVDLATVADLEAVLRALENNNYGFKILVAKNNNNHNNSDSEKKRSNQHVDPVPPKSTGIDYESRTYRTSTKQHPRPNVQQEPLVSSSTAAVKTGLPMKLLTDDAHSLERKGLYNMPKNKQFNYRNGRAYKTLPEKTKQFIDEKHSQSSGAYDRSVEKYIHKPDNDIKLNNISKCSVCFYACDTVCGRCSQYYCDIECQQSDWAQHRYICGKPKHLQKTPPPKKQNASCDREPSKNLKENNKIKSSEKNTKHSEENLKSNKSVSTVRQPDGSSTASFINSGKDSSQTTSKQIDRENMPRSGSSVVITAISKTNLLFVRSKTHEANLAYFNTIDTLQSVGKMLVPLKTIPKSGCVAIAKFQSQYNRVLVLQFKALEEIIVHLMDYGTIELMKLQDLYEAPEEFISRPRYAIPVLLKDVPDFYMTEETRKFMYTYLNNNINVEIRYQPEDFHIENKVYAVELIDETTQQNFNKMVLKLSKPVEPQNSNEICNRGYLKHKLLPTGANVEYFVMDNSLMCSGCISCTIKPYVQEIEKFQKQLQSYAESLPKESYTPRVDEFCIARYSVDGLWYRGLCLEAIGDGHPSIHFIDYGNITIVPIEDIRRYPPQFTFPIYTADCEIAGLPHNCDDKVVAKLEQLIPNGQTIKCENVTVFEEEHFYIISLPNVLEKLISCGFLQDEANSF